MRLHQLQALMEGKGCVRILVKELAANDNSKNQVYLGGTFEAVNCFPNLSIAPDDTGTHGPVFKAPLSFVWVDATGLECPAPATQLILYPQYPEVRVSGFLKGCERAPSSLMRDRLAGRILFLGVREDGMVFGHVVAPDDELANEFRSRRDFESLGVFRVVSVRAQVLDRRSGLLAELKRVHELGWIDSKRLLSDGSVVAYQAPNGGGYTLEAEIGIKPNGFSEPDFQGWELKQHAVKRLDACDSGVLTLMTPEPTGGVYSESGPIAFVRLYGHADKSGKPDRLNFAGIHRTGTRQPMTHLALSLKGYDAERRRITESTGAIVLTAEDGKEAAAWPFARLMKHWNRKHNMAAYIPSIHRIKPDQEILQYQYGRLIRLGEGTDFLLFLSAIAGGVVYYDPAVVLTSASSSSPKVHRRSQFRIRSRDLKCLYRRLVQADVLGGGCTG